MGKRGIDRWIPGRVRHGRPIGKGGAVVRRDRQHDIDQRWRGPAARRPRAKFVEGAANLARGGGRQLRMKVMQPRATRDGARQQLLARGRAGPGGAAVGRVAVVDARHAVPVVRPGHHQVVAGAHGDAG